MHEILRTVEEPRRCSYLPDETASLEYRLVDDLTADEYSKLLARGYRRFGHQLFRPACLACRKCISLRVEVQRFRPSRSQKRAWRRNARVQADLQPLSLSRQHLKLYRLYHQDMTDKRGWHEVQASAQSFAKSFLLGGGRFGRQWLFWKEGRLVGVAFMDEVADAVSMVYCFHHPSWRPDSPGTFSILTQIDYARRKGLQYAYLGYWIEKCGSMSYKASFRPHQILQGYPKGDEEPVWERA